MNPIARLRKLIESKSEVDKLKALVKGATVKNWKTTTIGIATVVLSIAMIWSPPEYQNKLANTQTQISVMAGLLGVGMIMSKDHDK